MKYEVIPLVILLKNIYVYLIADLLNYKYECKETRVEFFVLINLIF